jgi:ribose transport system substrate-binding protein
LLAAFCASALSQEPQGITEPVVFPPHNRNADECTPPPDATRTLVFAQDNQREFMEGVSAGLAAAASDRGINFNVVLANNDGVEQAAQVEVLIAAKVGAVVVAPVDALDVAPTLQRLIRTGAYVGTIVPPPAVSILNAPQYLTGKVLADAAVEHIVEQLDGSADVVLLTHDSLQFLSARFTAMRDALSALPGVRIVADISPVTVNEDGGAATMAKVLIADPTIDVVLGADTVVLGALRALREAGRDRPDQFLGGIDGEPEAVREIMAGGPYKASVALASPIFAYAMGQHAADWLEGKSIPQAMDILPIALSLENLDAYRADIADPAAVFKDPVRRDAYLRMYGNICYDTRNSYVNFPWTSEQSR